RSLGRTLIDLGYIRERDLVMALAEQVGLDFVDLSEHQIDPIAATLLPEQLARRYRALPIGERDGKLLGAMSDPASLSALVRTCGHPCPPRPPPSPSTTSARSPIETSNPSWPRPATWSGPSPSSGAWGSRVKTW